MAKTYTERGAATDTLVIDTDYSFGPTFVAGVTFYTDDTYTTRVSSVTGTMQIDGTSKCTEEWDSLDDGTIDLSTAVSPQATASSPLIRVRSVPSTVAGATHYKLTIVQYGA